MLHIVWCGGWTAPPRVRRHIISALFERERREHAVTPPKAIDNAIVNYVRLASGATVADLAPT